MLFRSLSPDSLFRGVVDSGSGTAAGGGDEERRRIFAESSLRSIGIPSTPFGFSSSTFSTRNQELPPTPGGIIPAVLGSPGVMYTDWLRVLAARKDEPGANPRTMGCCIAGCGAGFSTAAWSSLIGVGAEPAAEWFVESPFGRSDDVGASVIAEVDDGSGGGFLLCSSLRSSNMSIFFGGVPNSLRTSASPFVLSPNF